MNEHQPRGDVPARDRLSAAVDATKFREAMSRLGAAVHVVTTAGPAGNAGFTATAVTSVSDEPATLLVCLKRRSRITPVLRANGVFCVNTLAADMQDIADLFAGRTGIYMAGGGALLRGLDKRISMKTKLPVHIAEDPLRAVARGTGIALKNIHKFPFLIK